MTLLFSLPPGVGILLLITLYFLPWIIASARGLRDKNEVLAINILFGYTIIGWFIALGLALS